MEDEDIELGIQAALDFSSNEQGSCPQDIFVAGYGWIIRDGVATEMGHLWLKDYKSIGK